MDLAQFGATVSETVGGHKGAVWLSSQFADLTPKERPAQAVAEDLLHRTGDALMSDDLTGFRACFALPLLTESFSGQRVIETEDALANTFWAAVKYYRVHNVTDLVRQVVSASYQDDDTIHSLHESRCLSHRTLLDHQVSCFSRIVRDAAGAWRIDTTRYANSDAQQFDDIFSGRGTPPETLRS